MALPVLVWTGTFFYWHITIKREIREIESETPGVLSRATFIMISGGCRSIPYLIDVLESSRHPMLLDTAIAQIPIEVQLGGGPKSNEDGVELMQLLNQYPFTPNDTPEVRRANFQHVLAWWKASGLKYHQWWRVWSSNCAK